MYLVKKLMTKDIVAYIGKKQIMSWTSGKCQMDGWMDG